MVKGKVMVERVVSNFLESNVFVVGDENVCVIVDAAAEVQKVADVVAWRKVLGVLLTHGHYDHCVFCEEYAKRFGCKIYASQNIEEYLLNGEYNYSEGKFKLDNFDNFVFLQQNGCLQFDGISVEYVQLGGHSKSDMCYQIFDDVFVGDLVLGRDMGRIDLFGGSKEEMKNSLQFLINKKYNVMHSGHGADNNKATQDKVCSLWLRFLNRG